MSEFWTLITEPFSFVFMRQAFVMVFLVALPLSLLSPFLILRSWSLVGAALAHAVLPGIVLAHALAIPLKIGAFFSALLCVGASQAIQGKTNLKSDTVLGLVFAAFLGLGLLLMHAVGGMHHFEHIIFGNVLGIDAQDLWESAILAAFILSPLLIWRRDLTLMTFDRMHASAIGLNSRALNLLLLVLICAAIVGALQAAGFILVIAALIAPGAIAFLISHSFSQLLVRSIMIGVSLPWLGLYLSFFLDSSPAPTIATLFGLTFAGAHFYPSNGKSNHTNQGEPS